MCDGSDHAQRHSWRTLQVISCRKAGAIVQRNEQPSRRRSCRGIAEGSLAFVHYDGHICTLTKDNYQRRDITTLCCLRSKVLYKRVWQSHNNADGRRKCKSRSKSSTILCKTVNWRFSMHACISNIDSRATTSLRTVCISHRSFLTQNR